MRSRGNYFSWTFLIIVAGATLTLASPRHPSVYTVQRERSNAWTAWFSYARANYPNEGVLVVHRAADFGWELAANLKIDDVEVANVAWGWKFGAVLTPGHHVITVLSVPAPHARRPSSTVVYVRPGETYDLTAVWEGDQVVLR